MPSADCRIDSLETATALAPQFYCEPRWLAYEQDAVFKRSWQCVAHMGDLANTGDHVVAEVAGQPLVILHNTHGNIVAFHNVCRHRAGPLALCNGKGATRLRCAYHGWQYDLDGKLLTAPEMGEAADFDRSAVQLPSVQTRVWQNLVFVALDPDVPPIESVLAGIAERIQPNDLTRLKFHHRDVYKVACNWKVYIDNYLEGYHLPYVHPALTEIVDYANYFTDLADYYSLQHSPIRVTDGPYGDGTAFYYFIYPNIMLNIMPGRLQINRVLPTGQDSCTVDFDYYFADDADVIARAATDLAFSDQVQAEDASICAAVQRGLTSGSYVPGRISPKRESGVWHFQNLLRQVYARAG
jgi:choline monooxygenase